MMSVLLFALLDTAAKNKKGIEKWGSFLAKK
jgi:hypothetical protein